MLYVKKSKREGWDLPPNHYQFFEISTLFFCFHNKELLKELEERGSHLRDGNEEMIRKVSKKINGLISNENKIKYREPVCAYVTFKKKIASEIAKNLLKTKNKQGIYP